jgi:hypothetical protein
VIRQDVTTFGVDDTTVVLADGGSNETYVVNILNAPLPIVGERYLMFLRARQDPQFAYSFVGGPQGRYLVGSNDIVGGNEVAVPGAGVSAALVSRSLADVAAEVTQLASRGK